MVELSYYTRLGKNVYSSTAFRNKIYISYEKNDSHFLDRTIKTLLKIEDVAIFYIDYDLYPSIDISDLNLLIDQMELVIFLVSENYLKKNNFSYVKEYQYVLNKHIPFIPIVNDESYIKEYEKKFHTIQYLYENSLTNNGEISYFDKLKKQIQTFVINNEDYQLASEAFNKVIFLSYRKKDRLIAQYLMQTIHLDKSCQDIAIWYDEFLKAGDHFDQSIVDVLGKCDALVVLVTPNVINQNNYVRDEEYKTALKMDKKIFPIKGEDTNIKELKEQFLGIPELIEVYDASKEISSYLKEGKKELSKEKEYAIGLAYLHGVNVEVNRTIAYEHIKASADKGDLFAMVKLVDMLSGGVGVLIDNEEAIKVQSQLVDICKSHITPGVFDKSMSMLFHQKEKLFDFLRKNNSYVSKCLEDIKDDIELLNGINQYKDGYKEAHKYEQLSNIYMWYLICLNILGLPTDNSIIEASLEVSKRIDDPAPSYNRLIVSLFFQDDQQGALKKALEIYKKYRELVISNKEEYIHGFVACMSFLHSRALQINNEVGQHIFEDVLSIVGSSENNDPHIHKYAMEMRVENYYFNSDSGYKDPKETLNAFIEAKKNDEVLSTILIDINIANLHFRLQENLKAEQAIEEALNDYFMDKRIYGDHFDNNHLMYNYIILLYCNIKFALSKYDDVNKYVDTLKEDEAYLNDYYYFKYKTAKDEKDIHLFFNEFRKALKESSDLKIYELMDYWDKVLAFATTYDMDEKDLISDFKFINERIDSNDRYNLNDLYTDFLTKGQLIEKYPSFAGFLRENCYKNLKKWIAVLEGRYSIDDVLTIFNTITKINEYDERPEYDALVRLFYLIEHNFDPNQSDDLEFRGLVLTGMYLSSLYSKQGYMDFSKDVQMTLGSIVLSVYQAKRSYYKNFWPIIYSLSASLLVSAKKDDEAKLSQLLMETIKGDVDESQVFVYIAKYFDKYTASELIDDIAVYLFFYNRKNAELVLLPYFEMVSTCIENNDVDKCLKLTESLRTLLGVFCRYLRIEVEQFHTHDDLSLYLMELSFMTFALLEAKGLDGKKSYRIYEELRQSLEQKGYEINIYLEHKAVALTYLAEHLYKSNNEDLGNYLSREAFIIAYHYLKGSEVMKSSTLGLLQANVHMLVDHHANKYDTYISAMLSYINTHRESYNDQPIPFINLIAELCVLLSKCYYENKDYEKAMNLSMAGLKEYDNIDRIEKKIHLLPLITQLVLSSVKCNKFNDLEESLITYVMLIIFFYKLDNLRNESTLNMFEVLMLNTKNEVSRNLFRSVYIVLNDTSSIEDKLKAYDEVIKAMNESSVEYALDKLKLLQSIQLDDYEHVSPLIVETCETIAHMYEKLGDIELANKYKQLSGK